MDDVSVGIDDAGAGQKHFLLRHILPGSATRRMSDATLAPNPNPNPNPPGHDVTHSR